MSDIVIGVVADMRRQQMAWDLATQVNATVLSYDDGAMGPTKNHLKVWTKLLQHGGDWAVVLEDDAIVGPQFTTQLKQVLESPPAQVVSLYLGRGYPKAWQRFIKKAMMADDAHFIMSTHVLHGVALAMRMTLVEDMLRWVTWMSQEQRQWPVDEQITEWCRRRGYKVAYTKPSIVEHADGPSLLVHPDGDGRDVPRKAWEFGQRDEWDWSKAVEMP
jgi:GR25 family glycosyltransferase involved in LPS biosynthesis